MGVSLINDPSSRLTKLATPCWSNKNAISVYSSVPTIRILLDCPCVIGAFSTVKLFCNSVFGDCNKGTVSIPIKKSIAMIQSIMAIPPPATTTVASLS